MPHLVLGFVLLLHSSPSVTYLFGKGVGIFGIEIPIAWGFAITNFVWWIGIGHAGTLISAIPPAAESKLAQFDQSVSPKR